jgi:hypothetical protein
MIKTATSMIIQTTIQTITQALSVLRFLIPLGLVSVLLVGCQNDVFYHQSPNRHVIILEGQRMSVLKLNDGTWEVAGGNVSWSEDKQALIDRQLQAIMMVSGCAVVTSTAFEAGDGKPPRLIGVVKCKGD